jgi:polyferredoxin
MAVSRGPRFADNAAFTVLWALAALLLLLHVTSSGLLLLFGRPQPLVGPSLLMQRLLAWVLGLFGTALLVGGLYRATSE